MTMTFLESLMTSGVGFLIVFIGLAILIVLVSVMGKICGKLLDEKAPEEAPKKASAPAVACAKAEIEDRETLVAIFSAAVAEELGTDVSAIRVVSLKRVQ